MSRRWYASTSSLVPHSGSSVTPTRATRGDESRPKLGNRRGNHLALSAVQVVVVERHDRSTGADGLTQPAGIDAIQPRQVDQPDARPGLVLELLRRFERVGQHPRSVAEHDEVRHRPSRSIPRQHGTLLARIRKRHRPFDRHQPQGTRFSATEFTSVSNSAPTSASQHGSASTRFGTDLQGAAMSRTDWCEWPGPPGSRPASDPT